jgi:hypothetical protein
MALDTNVVGGASGNKQEVTAANQAKVVTETNASANPGNVGGARNFSENDQGLYTNVVRLASPEVDVDYRLRVAPDVLLDEEVFNTTVQNTGKHQYTTSTMTNTWTVGQLTTNGGNIITSTTGTIFQTYAEFPVTGVNTLSADFTAGFSANPQTFTNIEFGFMRPSTSAVAPSDGVYFQLNETGLAGVANFNGNLTIVQLPTLGGSGQWAYTIAKRYQFIVYLSAVQAEFWMNDGTGAVKLAHITLPAAASRMVLSSTLPLAIKHRITGGTAGGAIQATFGSYNVRQGGAAQALPIEQQGNAVFGSYQGLTGQTMGSLATYPNSANPTPAVPTNTTAALTTGLGGQFWETATALVNTDLIIQSFQVPPSTVSIPGRRLIIRGIQLMSHIQAVIVGGGYVSQWSLAFGHTAVSLGATESALGKAPRRIALPAFTQLVTAAQAATTIVSQPGGASIDFGTCPVYVNPGEFVQLVQKKIGTAATAGTVAHTVAFIYGWE